jgi:hypothetical protein
MRYLSVLLALLSTASAGGYPDPFLPTLPLGAGPDAVCDAMGKSDWTLDYCKVNPDGRTVIHALNPSGWLLHYEYASDGSPSSILTAEAWAEEGQQEASHDAWKERLSAQFGDPETVESAYGDLLRLTGDSCTVELDLHAPEFYVEGWYTLVVLVLFEEAGA